MLFQYLGQTGLKLDSGITGDNWWESVMRIQLQGGGGRGGQNMKCSGNVEVVQLD